MRILPALLFLIAAAIGAEHRSIAAQAGVTGVPVPPWQSPLSRDHVLAGRIWLPAEDRFVEPAELAGRLRAADFVLLGEKHDNTDHHRLQAWALEQIIAPGRRPALAFEMVSPEQEPAMRRHLAEHPGQIDGLDSALDWPNNHWPDWPNYRPLFAAALAAGMEVRSANLSLADVRTIARQQALPPAAVAMYRLDQPLDGAAAAAMADEIRDAHCGQLPEQMVPGMVDVQRARDAAMARAMTGDASAAAVLIAGAGHVRTDRGVPAQLGAMAPNRPVFSLAFIEVADGQDDPASYGESWGGPRLPFDAVWFTPRANDDDPCAGMADFIKKPKDAVEQ
ncbi:MAG: ChaN family lipoprotein [Aliidongia sp.]